MADRSPSRSQPRAEQSQTVDYAVIHRSWFQPTQVHRQQLRVAKVILAHKLPRTLPIDVDEAKELLSPRPLESEEKLAIILEEKISEFIALNRYEQRALSRRKAAIRNFDAARTLAIRQRRYEA